MKKGFKNSIPQSPKSNFRNIEPDLTEGNSYLGECVI